MKVAIEGCCHGELETIYDTIEHLEKKNNVKVDILLICGDFQSVRNTTDMECMAVPPKHRRMNSFYKYYSGEKLAPVLTVFIGGNHEATNYLQELPYGGWVAPNIYYLGYAGVVQFGGLRIGGMSGIYKSKDYMKGHFEHPPYTEDTKRSAYHIRNIDVFRLKQVKQPIDLFLSHDWPKGIYHYGDVASLLRKKKFFQDEIDKDMLGNPIAAELLFLLKPSYWFSAHLHVKFPAIVQHSQDDSSKVTKFLALDKCLPKRQFLQVLDIQGDATKPLKLQLDPGWLAILKSTNDLLSISKTISFTGSLPGERSDFAPTQDEISAIIKDFGGDMTIPDNFEKTVPVFNPSLSKQQNASCVKLTVVNPQTTLLCSMLDLTDPNAKFLGQSSTFKLEGIEVNEDSNESCSNDDEVDDDTYSESSFVSLSSSETSFDNKNLSFFSQANGSISTENESFLSINNSYEISSANNVEDTQKDDTENLNSCQEACAPKSIMKETGDIPIHVAPSKVVKRLSIAERLKMCGPSNSPSACNTSLSSATGDDDDEFVTVMAANKKISASSNNIVSAKSETELEIVDYKKNSTTSSDSKFFEIADDDLELKEMLKAQKRYSLNEVGDALESKDLDNSNSCNDSVLKVEKYEKLEGSCKTVPESDSEMLNEVAKKIEADRISQEKAAQKRIDTPTHGSSPASKKLKRRNQDVYLNECPEEL